MTSNGDRMFMDAERRPIKTRKINTESVESQPVVKDIDAETGTNP